MTDYNNGEWHTWGGADTKPAKVHPESEIDYVWFDERHYPDHCGSTNGRKASRNVAWAQVLKFRVVKEHKEPREFWVDPDLGRAVTWYHPKCIHVREVIE